MTRKIKTILLFIFTTTLLPQIHADQIWTKNGSIIIGQIQSITDGKIIVSTAFAGNLTIESTLVDSIQTEDLHSIKLNDGSIVTSSVDGSPSTKSSISTSRGSQTISIDSIVSLWKAGDPEPLKPDQKTKKTPTGNWKFEVATGINGKSGSSNKSDFNGSGKATMEIGGNRLELALRYQFAENKNTSGINQRTAEEIIGTIHYVSFFSDNFGWYIREEMERDRFENIDFRSSTASGITWKAVDDSRLRLEVFGGLSYRYMGYGFELEGNDSHPGIDFGVNHYWKLTEWAELTNMITYNPIFEDFGNYRLDHLSTLDVPLGLSDQWKLRISLSNQYRSISTSSENWDTSYSLSLLLNWK